MGSLDGIWSVQRSHQPLSGPGVCLAGVQLDRHEGGIGAGETTLPPPGDSPGLTLCSSPESSLHLEQAGHFGR